MKLKDVVKSIQKQTKAQTIDESAFAKVTEFLDSGSYAINRVLTGDIHKGFAVGRVTTLFGLSQSGKSLIAANTIVNALKNNQVDVVYIFDSEGGTLVDFFKKHDVDLSKINHIPVASIEQCSVKMLQVYDELVKARQEYLDDPENNDNIRALCVLDSYGALAADKLVNDAVNKDKTAMDMGLGAKLKNNMMRGLMMRVVQSNATLLVINHAYQDPGAMFTSKIQNMAGGKGIEFASHVILQCEKVFVKSTDMDFLTGLESNDDEVGFYKGNKLKFFTVKNRVCKPMFTAQVYLDFSSGISKYDGLIADAVKFGFLQEVRGGYVCPSYSDKKVTYKDLVKNDEIWATFLEKFNEKSKTLMEYSNATSRELDKIEAELDESEEAVSIDEMKI